MTKLSGARVELPREEYDAFCYLRDVTHQDLKAKVEQLQRLVEQQDFREASSKALINTLSTSLEYTRKHNLTQHELILKMQRRLGELEPVKCETPPPGSKR